MKKKVIVINEMGARIHSNPSNIDELREIGTVVENPDLSEVAGISPSFWKLNENGIIVPMSDDEMALRSSKMPSKPVSAPQVAQHTPMPLTRTYDDSELHNEIDANAKEMRQKDEAMKDQITVVHNRIGDVMKGVRKERTEDRRRIKELEQCTERLTIATMILCVATIISMVL